MTKKIMIVFGTRPEAIKMAPLCHEFIKDPSFQLLVCNTGQHRELIDPILSAFSIQPDIELALMSKGQSLIELTNKVILHMQTVLVEEKPDLVLVHGDTSTAYATALACFYLGIDVGHIEAGLRTYDMSAPFPEEFNRRSIALIARYHFAPTALSRQNLLDEKVNINNILVTGNTVIDALQWTCKRLNEDQTLLREIRARLLRAVDFEYTDKKFVLVTGHRRENFGNGFLNICKAIKTLANENPTVNFVYPVHLNPKVINPVKSILSDIENIKLIKPLEYQDFVHLLQNASIVLTDSGGIQEEAPSLGKPVLVMRDHTERPEGIAAGTVKLVGSAEKKIVENVQLLLTNRKMYEEMSISINPYGDGHASSRIVNFLKNEFHFKECN